MDGNQALLAVLMTGLVATIVLQVWSWWFDEHREIRDELRPEG
jgi:hypothetical protein